MKITQLTCPSCCATLPTLRKGSITCEYCGTQFYIEELEEIAQKTTEYKKSDCVIKPDDDSWNIDDPFVVKMNDPLFEKAKQVVIHTQQGSVSIIQRRLRVGYSRAASLMDMLEQAGVVGPFQGSKARDVLVEHYDEPANSDDPEECPELPPEMPASKSASKRSFWRKSRMKSQSESSPRNAWPRPFKDD